MDASNNWRTMVKNTEPGPLKLLVVDDLNSLHKFTRTKHAVSFAPKKAYCWIYYDAQFPVSWAGIVQQRNQHQSVVFEDQNTGEEFPPHQDDKRKEAAFLCRWSSGTALDTSSCQPLNMPKRANAA